MGQRTLGEFWADIRDALQRPTLDTAKITRWVNQSMKEFGYAFKLQELQAEATLTTVAGTASYGMATNLRSLSMDGVRISLPVESIRRLKKENRSQYLRRLVDTSNTQTYGVPSWYHSYGHQMYLRTIPDKVYTISYDYWKSLTEITGTDDVTPFTDDWDDVTLTGAMYRGFRAQGEHDRYINIRNDFIGMVRSRALDEDLEEFETGGLNIITDSAMLEMDTDG